jgi:hypothetical protein
MKKRKFTIRIYTPGDPFHLRETFWEKRKNGDEFLQYAIGNWAIMFSWIDTEGKPMPFFMWVNSD